MKSILLWSKWSELKLDLWFSPQLIFSGNNVLAWSLLGHVHLSLCQKHKLRVANAVNNLFMVLTQLWVLCSLTYGKSMSWGWLLWGMLLKVGLNEQIERKNKSKVTQEFVERKLKKKKNIQELQTRKEESHLHKWRKKIKWQGERIWETG